MHGSAVGGVFVGLARSNPEHLCWIMQVNMVPTLKNRLHVTVDHTMLVAPVVQVVNLEFYVFEFWVRAQGGSGFDFICKKKKGFNC